MYFDQQTGALYAIRCSQLSFSDLKNIFLHHKQEKCKKKGKNKKNGSTSVKVLLPNAGKHPKVVCLLGKLFLSSLGFFLSSLGFLKYIEILYKLIVHGVL